MNPLLQTILLARCISASQSTAFQGWYVQTHTSRQDELRVTTNDVRRPYNQFKTVIDALKGSAHDESETPGRLESDFSITRVLNDAATPQSAAVRTGSLKVMTTVGPQPCEPGFYCPGDGMRYACPGGTFGSTFALSTPTCTGPTLAGWFSAGGADRPDAAPCGSAAMYCTEGSSAPTTVSPGHYSITTGSRGGNYVASPRLVGGEVALDARRRAAHMTVRMAQRACIAGTYCLHGLAFLCPSGRYGSLSGSIEPACEGAASPGYYTYAGATSPDYRACGSAAAFCPPGSAAPIAVRSGWFSTSGRTTTRGGSTPDSGVTTCIGDHASGEGAVILAAKDAPESESVSPSCTIIHGGVLQLNSSIPQYMLSSIAVPVVAYGSRCRGGAKLGDEDTRSDQQLCLAGK